MSILGGRISEKGCNLDGCCGFDAFPASHGECPAFVGPRNAPRALGAVATDAFGGPKSFVSELGIANPSISNDEKHLASDSEYVQSMMRETR